MGKIIKGLLEELSAFQKFMAVAITILIAVFTSGAYFSGVLGMPEELRANVETTEFIRAEQIRNFEEHGQINVRLDKILCNQDPEMSWDQCELRYGGRER